MVQVNSAPSSDVLDFIQSKAQLFENRPALSIKEGDHWQELSYKQLSQRAVALASHLIEVGVQPQQRVAIFSESKPEWGIAFFGIVVSGAIAVPLDIKLTEAELVNILSNCTPHAVLVDSKRQPLMQVVARKVESIKHIINIDADSKLMRTISSEPFLPARFIKPKRELDEVALIVYTS